jgi:hypothetical protein
MRLRGMVAAVTTIAMLAVPLAALASTRTYVFPATGSNAHGSIQGVYRPSRIVFTQDGTFWMTNIRWRGWNTHRAVGHGTAHENNCRPSCAQGRTVTVRSVQVVANRRTKVTGYWAYEGLWCHNGRFGVGNNWAAVLTSIS